MQYNYLLELLIEDSYMMNKPENQDEDALGKIEQQQDFVILELGAQLKCPLVRQNISWTST